MKIDNYADASTLLKITNPITCSVSSYATAAVDKQDYSGEVILINAATIQSGTARLDMKLQHATDSDNIGAITYSGTGNGKITQCEACGDAVTETITVHLASATSATVTGSVSGAIGTATVGTVFTSPQITFLLVAGSTAFVHTDEFSIAVTGRIYSDVDGTAIHQLHSAATASISTYPVNISACGRYIRTLVEQASDTVSVITSALIGLKDGK